MLLEYWGWLASLLHSLCPVVLGFLDSSTVKGPIFFSACLQLSTNLDTHAVTRRALCRLYFSNTIYNWSGQGWSRVTIATFRTTFASASDVMVGHHVLRPFTSIWSQSGPFHQNGVRCPPLRARSAGFYDVGTCLQWISGCWWILLTRFDTNCLHCPFLRIQWRATVLSNQAKISGAGRWSKAFFTLTRRLFIICEDMSSRRRMVSPCLASRLVTATRRWVTPDDCRTTE